MWKANAISNADFVKRTIDELPNYNFKRPAVVVGAGYNIEKSLAVISKVSPRASLVIISCDKALPACLDAGIDPDYIVSLNTEKTDAVEPDRWYEDVSLSELILPVTAHPCHVQEWYRRTNGEIYWMVPMNIDPALSEELGITFGTAPIARGSNAGEFSYLMAAYMGCSPIALIGMPYAFKTLVDVLKFQSPDRHEYHYFYEKTTGACYTTLGFMDERTEFLEVADQFSAKVDTFNCTEGGILYSDKCRRMTIEDFLELVV